MAVCKDWKMSLLTELKNLARVATKMSRLRRWKISRRDYVIQPSVVPTTEGLRWVEIVQ